MLASHCQACNRYTLLEMYLLLSTGKLRLTTFRWVHHVQWLFILCDWRRHRRCRDSRGVALAMDLHWLAVGRWVQ